MTLYSKSIKTVESPSLVFVPSRHNMRPLKRHCLSWIWFVAATLDHEHIT